jgi:alkylated DNA repair dioxygenase AlkB
MKKNLQTRYKEIEFNDEKDKIAVKYNRDFLNKVEADHYFKILEEKLVYNSDDASQIVMFGKKMSIPRKQVAYGDPDIYYTYSGLKVKTIDWTIKDEITTFLLEIRDKVQKESGKQFNFVLINRYADGEDYIGFHADDEKDLGDNPSIIGISLGAERPFQLKPNASHCPIKTPHCLEISLAHGSYIAMNFPTNQFWKHSVPKRTSVRKSRISLTFRNILN